MSDDLREQIAQALIRERQRRLAGVSMDSALADADAVLAVVQPVIEQAERERDQWRTEAAHWSSRPQEEASRARAAEARVATLEAALAESQDLIRRMAFGGVVVGYEIRDQLDRNGAVLGEQDTAADIRFSHDEDCSERSRSCPTCRSDDPARQQGLPHTDLHAQIRCRDPWHAVHP